MSKVKAQHNTSFFVKQGRHFLIPAMLLVTGSLIFCYAGWNLFRDTYLIGKLMFSKPQLQFTEKKFVINNVAMYRPKIGSQIGDLVIPSINLTYPFLHGDDDEELSNGVGHDPGTALPGENNNVVITGHRDTVFRNLGKVKAGDLIILKTYYGDFTYKAVNMRVVKETDPSVIVKSDKEMLTIYTCYPFEYIGNPTERYVVTCEFVEVSGNKELKVEEVN